MCGPSSTRRWRWWLEWAELAQRRTLKLEPQALGAADEDLADAGVGDAAGGEAQPEAREACLLGVEVEGREGEVIDPPAALPRSGLAALEVDDRAAAEIEPVAGEIEGRAEAVFQIGK